MEYRVDKMLMLKKKREELSEEEAAVVSVVEGTIDLSSSSSRRAARDSILLKSSSSSSSLSSSYEEPQDQPTDLSKKKNTNKKADEDHQDVLPPKLLRKHKPIPPPLVLLSINQNQSQIHHHHNQQHPQHQSPNSSSSGSTNTTPSPKHNDKNLPLRKRWHSCSLSLTPMNGQQDESPPMVPLYYPDANNAVGKTGLAGGETTTAAAVTQPSSTATTTTQNQYHHHHLPSYSSPGGHGHSPYSTSARWLDFVPVSTPTPTTTSPPTRLGQISNGPQMNGHSHHHNPHPHPHAHSGTTSNGDLQTPTPFYTPNEPSPKFMNSPIFSYSSPDTALYQGPFSPIRASSLYPPPSSPFTNLSLNSPLLPVVNTQGGGGGNGNGGGSQSSTTSTTPVSSMSSSSSGSSSCFNNMIPSTLLSPAPSQASTNSLSYEDLHENKLFSNVFQPTWSIFQSGTKVRFVNGMSTTEWYAVEILGQNAESLGLKGDYAPQGLEVRKLIVTSSVKERIQVTFCPVGDPLDPHQQPTIEVNCEPGHPFMVDKKGWCAVKPEVFQEIYGVPCQPLEGGDICLNFSVVAKSPNQQSQSHYQGVHSHHSAFASNLQSGSNGIHQATIKVEPGEEKPVPVSLLSQSHHLIHHSSSVGLSPSSSGSSGGGRGSSGSSRKTFAGPMPSSTTPAKKAKEGKHRKHNNANNQQNGSDSENKGRRPMNGFLLFAKDKRPELIQMYPGKDNRSISVLLGEAWQSLDPTERERYSLSAKLRADEHKKLHPNCWKRKRSQSITSINP